MQVLEVVLYVLLALVPIGLYTIQRLRSQLKKSSSELVRVKELLENSKRETNQHLAETARLREQLEARAREIDHVNELEANLAEARDETERLKRQLRDSERKTSEIQEEFQLAQKEWQNAKSRSGGEKLESTIIPQVSSPNPTPEAPPNTYDVVFKFNSLKTLAQSGWQVQFPSKNKNVQEHIMSEAKSLSNKEPSDSYQPLQRKTVSVVGHYGKGKSLVANGLYQVNVPSGNLVTTEGLSVCFLGGTGSHLENNNQFVLIDTEGSYSPIGNQDPQEILFTKASEMFMSEMVFNISNFFIVVVNDITWPDQEFINSLRFKVKEFTPEHRPTIFVVHNFKEATTVNEIHQLFERQVRRIFNGSENSFHGAKYYASKHDGVEIRHFMLGRNGYPETDEFNRITFQMINAILTSSQTVSELSLCTKIQRYCRAAIPSYFRGNHEVCWDATKNDELVLKFEGPPSDLKYIFEYNSSGYGINLYQTGFELFAEVVPDGKNFCFLADVPGLQDENQIEIVDDESETEKQVVLIKGERQKPNISHLDQDMARVLDRMRVHAKQRRFGDFVLRLTLPFNVTPTNYKGSIQNGVLKVPLSYTRPRTRQDNKESTTEQRE